jgi:hypothetical protein
MEKDTLTNLVLALILPLFLLPLVMPTNPADQMLQ